MPLRKPQSRADCAAKRIREECLAVRLHRLTREVTRIYDQALSDVDITTSQLSILVVLQTLGEVRPGQIIVVLQMDKSTVSRTVDRMIDHGWVIAKEDADDQRGVVLALTAAGRRQLVRAIPAWETAKDDVEAMLPASLCRVLGRMGLAPPAGTA